MPKFTVLATEWATVEAADEDEAVAIFGEMQERSDPAINYDCEAIEESE